MYITYLLSLSYTYWCVLWSKAGDISPGIASNCDWTMILFCCLAALLLITQAVALNCIGRSNFLHFIYLLSSRKDLLIEEGRAASESPH